MKKRWLQMGICLMLLLLFGILAPVYAGDSVGVSIKGKAVVFSDNTGYPFIDGNNRTQVPLRVTMEAYGCDVSWDADTKTASVKKDDTTVQVPVGKSYLLVNGKTVQNDTVALIKNSRTYLPIRAVLEAFGATVNWNGETKTVEVDKPLDLIGITSISVRSANNGYYVDVAASKAFDSHSSFSLNNPNRFVVDIAGAALRTAAGTLSESNGVFSSVRYSQFDSTVVRVVIDLKSNTTGTVSLSSDKKTLSIYFKNTSSSSSRGSSGSRSSTGSSSDSSSTGTGTTTPSSISGIPALTASMQDKLIVIDPGHGGNDSGAVGTNAKGEEVYEKTINLKVATLLTELLQSAGAVVKMTHTGDTTMALYDRPALANNENAYLLVSCHNNSSTAAAATGTETHYNGEKDESGYALTSQELAESVQAELVKTIGLKNRKTHNSPELAIVRRSNMPAIIIEGGFMSNADDLAYMQTDQFVEAYAKGAAVGIINALNAAAAK